MNTLSPLAEADAAWAARRRRSTAERLAASAWAARDIPPPDFLMGEWLSTTSRAILSAATGIGKTNFAMALAFAVAAGTPFLHWSAPRGPRTVLYIDGEMSRRLVQARIRDAARRTGIMPERLFVLCRDDEEELPPLNTGAGQAFIDRIVGEIGGVEFISFDNIMSLISGDMKEEEGWSDTLPWIKDLTKRSIGQFWVHHSGHDASRGYGTSTRLWQVDTAIHLDAVEGNPADIAFTLRFGKARERTPQNRTDFCDALVTLADDTWSSEPAERKAAGKAPSPKAQAFHRALLDAVVAAGERRTETAGRPSVLQSQWWSECVRLGLLDAEDSNRRRALTSKYRTELVAAGWAACNGDFAWSVRGA